MGDSKLATICTVIIAIVAILTLYYTVYSPSAIKQEVPQTEKQTTTNNFKQLTGLLRYENSTYGVSVQYPSDWTKNETNYFDKSSQYQDIVSFNSPGANTEGNYIVGFSITTDRYPSSLDLNKYMKNEIKNLRDDPQNANFQLLESSTNSFLGGHPAYKTVYTYTPPDSHIIHQYIETGTLIDGKVYYIYVIVDADKYPYYLPTIQKMIDSFQIM
jgi:hypothetical protein